MKQNDRLRNIRPILILAFAWAVFFIKSSTGQSWLTFLAIPALIMCTLVAVHHAEVIALRVGEPFGTLVLALSVTILEVSLIISMMFASGAEGATLARDTVYAAIMIILTGMVGLSLLAGGIKFHQQRFALLGVNAVITVLLAISVLTLILPNYTESVKGAYYSNKQLVFVSIVSLVLYGSFIFVQNFKHKDLFLTTSEDITDPEIARPSAKASLFSLLMLLLCLGAVILLAKSLAPDLDVLIHRLNAPTSLAGIIIACIILLPEGLSAYRAASKDRLQTSLNLSLGSALASICLTIPVVAAFSIYFNIPLELGLDSKSTLLLILALLVSMLSFSTGKTITLQGVVLLVIFATYIFMTVVP